MTGPQGVQESRDVLYVDEEILTELVLLRRLAATHNRIKTVEHGAVNEDQQAMSIFLHRMAHNLLNQYNELVRKDQQTYDEAVGVVIGRFQVPELHDGHKFILETVRKRHPNFAVVIGVAPQMNERNPLNYHMRATMIQEQFPDAVTMPILDQPDDKAWSENLDQRLREAFPVGKIRLYGSRDSFIPFYFGQFPATEITPTESWSATQIRTQVGEQPLNNAEFRKGVIFATQAGRK